MLALKICFINLIIHAVAEPVARIRKPFNDQQAIEYNEIRSSKLRILLLGDLLKPKSLPLQDINCLSSTSSINVTTNKCPCENFLCKSKERSIGIAVLGTPTTTLTTTALASAAASSYNNSTASSLNNAIQGNHIKQRPIHTTCYDICCRNKHKRTVSRSIDSKLHIASLSNNNNAVVYDDEQYNNKNKKKPNQNSYNTCTTPTNNNPSNGNSSSSSTAWLVKIISKSIPHGECAGSLIHEKMVLTTAVCVFKMRADDLLIKMEYFNVDKNQWAIVDRKVRQIIIPENFSRTMEKLENNIAILVLENNGADDVVDKRTTATDGNEKNVKSHFNTICLPTKNIELKECYVAAWIFNNQKNLPIKSVHVNELKIFSMNECREKHNNRSEDYNKYFHDGNICAGKMDMSDINVNLSGSPLICIEEKNQINHFVIPGLLTWSTKINKSPHLFTNVSEYTNWIHEQMAKLEIY